jgi:hypothetical protein
VSLWSRHCRNMANFSGKYWIQDTPLSQCSESDTPPVLLSPRAVVPQVVAAVASKAAEISRKLSAVPGIAISDPAALQEQASRRLYPRRHTLTCPSEDTQPRLSGALTCVSCLCRSGRTSRWVLSGGWVWGAWGWGWGGWGAWARWAWAACRPCRTGSPWPSRRSGGWVEWCHGGLVGIYREPLVGVRDGRFASIGFGPLPSCACPRICSGEFFFSFAIDKRRPVA